MKILFDIGHPAHFHLFKNLIFYLQNNGIDYVVVSRDKEITNTLLEHFNIPFITLSKPQKGLLGMFNELISRTIAIIKLHKKERFTLSIGTSVSIGFLSLFKGVESWNFNEDDDAIVPLYTCLAYPFCNKIVNPDCIEFTKWKKKRILLNSYHELAYLHPEIFKPEETILEKYNLQKGKYIIARFSALQAHHDTKAKGISNELWNKIEDQLSGFTIIKSIEGNNTHEIDPWDMDNLLSFAKMIICDSQTMAAESMILGTPSIRINTFVGKISYLNELENKYNLGYGFYPYEEKEIFDTIKYLGEKNDVETIWEKKRLSMLDNKMNLNQWMIDSLKMKIKV